MQLRVLPMPFLYALHYLHWQLSAGQNAAVIRNTSPLCSCFPPAAIGVIVSKSKKNSQCELICISLFVPGKQGFHLNQYVTKLLT